MGDKPTPAKVDSKAEADARRAKQHAADSAAPQSATPLDGKPFPSPAKNTAPPEEHPPEPEIKRRHPEPTD